MTTHALAGPAAAGPPADGTVYLAQIPMTVRLQLLAAQLSEAKGTDPDRAITGGWAEARLWSAGAPAD
jgi:hypothetical protein